MAVFDSPAITPGSTVLITGSNGFVGAHVADQLLQQGCKVRGTVRDAAKHQWLVDLFSQKYGEDKFELITVKDMREPGAFDDAVSGVSGIAHVASVRDMHVTPDELIRTTVAGTLSCLQAAAKEPSVKRFVLTSSSAAVRSLQAYRGTDTVSADEYDEQTLALSKNIPDTLPPMHKFMIGYFASKVAAEQAFWKWVKNNKPHFSVNAVLPCTIYGSPLSVTHQGYPSTARIPLQILDGDVDSIKHVQRCCFVSDVGLVRADRSLMLGSYPHVGPIRGGPSAEVSVPPRKPRRKDLFRSQASLPDAPTTTLDYRQFNRFCLRRLDTLWARFLPSQHVHFIGHQHVNCFTHVSLTGNFSEPPAQELEHPHDNSQVPYFDNYKELCFDRKRELGSLNKTT
ncbi:NAD(P)-binding protein [Alternaria alternata]|nr:NAD(P)-binding protein [Alternaria alternata]